MNIWSRVEEEAVATFAMMLVGEGRWWMIFLFSYFPFVRSGRTITRDNLDNLIFFDGVKCVQMEGRMECVQMKLGSHHAPPHSTPQTRGTPHVCASAKLQLLGGLWRPRTKSEAVSELMSRTKSEDSDSRIPAEERGGGGRLKDPR